MTLNRVYNNPHYIFEMRLVHLAIRLLNPFEDRRTFFLRS